MDKEKGSEGGKKKVCYDIHQCIQNDFGQVRLGDGGLVDCGWVLGRRLW